MPALNEALTVGGTIARLKELLGARDDLDLEILVIDDGSSDGTGEVAEQAGARVIRHAYNLGNGASIKRGIRAATGDYILMMDADGQHRPEDVPRLLELASKFDMVVGARNKQSETSIHRDLANATYNFFASYVTGRKIWDLTSGFRIVRADVLKRFVYLLPNTFSYPTTITLSLFRAGYSVHYMPIQTRARQGKSKIKLFKDGSRFFLIILKIAVFFSPLKVFVPLSAGIGALGAFWYLVTYLSTQRFTNMGVVLITMAVMTFGLGLISEQIAQLRFERSEDNG
ncbi:MAG: glycosyltransferase family 2 protein [Planctomycetota bacterium]